MTKVCPGSEMSCVPSTSTAPSKSGFFASITDKVVRYMIRKLDRRELSATGHSLEMTMGNGPMRQNSLGNLHITIPVYQQSSTRRLAFGETTSIDESNKPINDFYNNSTLTNISKLFCAVVLLTAFFMVMSRSFSFNDGKKNNSTESFFF